MKRVFIIIFLFVVLQGFCKSKHIVFLVGERFNLTTQTMPALAVSLEDKFKFETTYVSVPKNGKVKALENLNTDLLILYLDMRSLPEAQISLINRYIESGKPVIAFNSTNRAFENFPKWFFKYFGGAYRGKTKGRKSVVTVNPQAIDHPVLQNLPSLTFASDQAVSIPGPLSFGATPLLMGKTELSPAFPVAWINSFRQGQRLFYTSLGRPKDFKNPSFIKVIENAVHWCFKMDKPVLETAVEMMVPEPPEMKAPKDATILFEGKNLSQWRHWDLLQSPRSIDVPANLQDFSALRNFPNPSWEIKNKTLVCNPSMGDIITEKSFGNYTLNLNFYIPKELEGIPTVFRGSGGVFISGRYEVKIKAGKDRKATSAGALNFVRPPDYTINMQAGKWHSMRIVYKQLNKGPAKITVRINGTPVHVDTILKDPTPYGIIEPLNKENPEDLSLFTADEKFTHEKLKMGENKFSVAARFKTTANEGTIFARTSNVSGWEKDGKAFFIGRNGRLYYDIGWRGMLFTAPKVNDGQWHHAVLTHDNDMCIMYIDGKVAFMKKNFKRPDPVGHVLKIGYSFKDFYRPFKGEISNFRYYPRQLSEEEAVALSKGLKEPVGATLNWQSKAKSATVIVEPKKSGPEYLKGPIRLHSDFSKIRYANIWLQENK